MLNQQKNKVSGIDWCDWTLNPISGCLHNCWYCYIDRIDNRFKSNIKSPKIKLEVLKSLKSCKLKTGDKIFVGSSGDMFGEWVNSHFIYAVLEEINKYPQFTFIFLTKNPIRYSEFSIPENCWLGMSVDTNNRLKSYLPILYLNGRNHKNIKFISFEPLLEEIDSKLLNHLNKINLKWLIIGGNSNPGANKNPDEWADKIIQEARKCDIPVWIKNNFKYHRVIKEFPKYEFR